MWEKCKNMEQRYPAIVYTDESEGGYETGSIIRYSWKLYCITKMYVIH